MFENLTDKLDLTFRNLTGKGTLSEANIDDAMREIRMALLDADVNFKIVKDYISEVKAECLGERVLKGINPGQMTKSVVHKHLVSLMGEANVPLEFKEFPASIMMVGLHGAGKTTTSAKLALHIKKTLNKKPLLVAADLMRPAAIDQLEALGKQIDIEVFAMREGANPVVLANEARAYARHNGFDVLIFDTAGRLQIADDLVQELVSVKQILNPSEILLVADSALGQEAVSVADHFNQALDITGIVLTKLDGDARGGAALSMRKVTGKPIKFIGIGEKMEELQNFHPDRMADRILGMGDVATLVDNIQGQIDEDEAKKLEEKMLKNKFDFNDFLSQIKQVRKLGGLNSIMSYLPGGKKMMGGADVDEDQLKYVEAVVLSMTTEEREQPQLMRSNARRQRVAKGAGRPLLEVQQLIKRFNDMKGIMSQMGKMAQHMDEDGNISIAPDRQISAKKKKELRKKKKQKRKQGKKKRR
ncbi:MAG: signal recognition particle protein [Lentisphaeria bacterium]|nr:signal recognition particle protein [Lentisphaeria bacterium]NQZ67139.1 signal recognition particle protein [Lentisphaeria bacterium]